MLDELNQDSLRSPLEALHFHASRQADLEVLRFMREDSGQVLTFAELYAQIELIAEHIHSRVQPGARALLIYPAGLEFIAAFMACLYAGITAVPCYPPGRQNRSFVPVLNVIKDCEPELILCSQGMQELLRTHLEAAGLSGTCAMICTDTLQVNNVRPKMHLPEIDPDTLAFLQYTSGSTGQPKGVMISHANLMHNLNTIRSRFRHSRASRGVIWLPPYHDMGLIGGILQPLTVGFPVLLMGATSFVQKPLRWLQAVSDFRATTSGGPNFAYELALQKISAQDAQALDLRSWEVAFTGAEPVSARVLDAFAEKFAAAGFRKEAFYPCYGMAEATLFVSGARHSQLPVYKDVCAQALSKHQVQEVVTGAQERQTQRLVACGAAADEHEVFIVNPETCTPAAHAEVGEIWVSGPSVAQGYWRQPELTARNFQARLAGEGERDWMRTGDLGFFAEGQLYIVGRCKDLIIIRGRNYHPQDIENTLELAHAAIKPSACAAFSVTLDDEEKLVLVAELKREALKEDTEAIIRQVRRAVAERHELKTHAVVLIKPASLPKTTSGKVKRHACRADFLAGNLAQVAAWQAAAAGASQERRQIQLPPAGASAALIEQWLVEAIAAQLHLQTNEIDVQAMFSSFGFDSLELVTLSGELAQWLEYRVPATIFNEPATISSVSHYLATARDISSGIARMSEEEKQSLLGSLGADQSLRDRFDGAVIPERFSRFEHSDEYQAFEQRQNMLFSARGKSPFFTIHQGVNNDQTLIDGRQYINFSCNNFLGLSGDPRVTRAAQQALSEYGSSVSASRLVSGERPLHQQLEAALAQWLGLEAALVFVGAATTNVTVVGHLMGPNDLILYDELSHNSLLQGVELSHADAQPFRHNDFADLDRILSSKRRQYEKVLIFIEGLYSMDGDKPDLQAFIEVKNRHAAWLMVDECLSMGTVGASGRGIGEYAGVERGEVDIWMGGISKALASCGGYIGGKRSLVNYLKYTAPGFIYTTGISPPNAAAALAALQILEQEPQLVAQLHARVALFMQLAREAGLDTGGCQGGGPIVPILVGDQGHCIQLYSMLFAKGINVQPILFPAVAANAARLRFSFNSTHTEEQVRYTVSAIAQALHTIRAQDSHSQTAPEVLA